ESATYVLLAPALTGALLTAWRGPAPLSYRAGLLLSYGLLLVDQSANWFPWGRQVRSIGLQPLAAVLLLLCLVVTASRKLWRPSAIQDASREISASARAA